MLPRMADLRGLVANLAFYLGLRKSPPPFAEFDYMEKAEYWALIWGAIVMAVTGIVLWFPNEFSAGAPYWLIPVSEKESVSPGFWSVTYCKRSLVCTMSSEA